MRYIVQNAASAYLPSADHTPKACRNTSHNAVWDVPDGRIENMARCRFPLPFGIRQSMEFQPSESIRTSNQFDLFKSALLQVAGPNHELKDTIAEVMADD